VVILVLGRFGGNIRTHLNLSVEELFAPFERCMLLEGFTGHLEKMQSDWFIDFGGAGVRLAADRLKDATSVSCLEVVCETDSDLVFQQNRAQGWTADATVGTQGLGFSNKITGSTPRRICSVL